MSITREEAMEIVARIRNRKRDITYTRSLKIIDDLNELQRFINQPQPTSKEVEESLKDLSYLKTFLNANSESHRILLQEKLDRIKTIINQSLTPQAPTAEDKVRIVTYRDKFSNKITTVAHRKDYIFPPAYEILYDKVWDIEYIIGVMNK